MVSITPQQLQERLEAGNGVRVVDVREPDEFARGHIPGARCIPASGLNEVAGQWSDDTETVVVCWSGARASRAADRLAAMGLRRVALLQGGTRAWQQAGLSTERSKRGLPLQRQVLIGAGLINLLSLGLALLSPWFLAVAVFASAMLVVAGATGFCPMAIALSHMPWNQGIASVPGPSVESGSCVAEKGGASCPV